MAFARENMVSRYGSSTANQKRGKMTFKPYELETIANVRKRGIAQLWIDAAEQLERLEDKERYKKEIRRCRNNAANIIIDLAEQSSTDVRVGTTILDEPILGNEYFVTLMNAASTSFQVAQLAKATGEHLTAKRYLQKSIDNYEEAVSLLEEWLNIRRDLIADGLETKGDGEEKII